MFLSPVFPSSVNGTTSCSNLTCRGLIDFLLGLTSFRSPQPHLQAIPWVSPPLYISIAKNPVQATIVSNLDGHQYSHHPLPLCPCTIHLQSKWPFKHMKHTISLHYSKPSDGFPRPSKQNCLWACLSDQLHALKAPSSQALCSSSWPSSFLQDAPSAWTNALLDLHMAVSSLSGRPPLNCHFLPWLLSLKCLPIPHPTFCQIARF